jgi:Ser-tRNA(Ala) deacylase AlaX
MRDEIMKRVFWDAPYQRSLNTKVAEVSGNLILLDETIAFSFSGGQESDQATINGISVIDSIIEDQLIYYTLEKGHGLQPGDDVFMEIDWQRRYRLMRLHFAAELILELITRKLGLEKIGAHIAETKARIDFAWNQNISAIFEELLFEYNQIIQRNEIIQTGFRDVVQQRRYWKIDGFAEVPCGGTHVKSTAEVGYVTLKRVNIGSGKERIEIKLVNDGDK